MRPLRSTHVAGSPKSLLVYDRWGEFGRPVLLLHDEPHDRTVWWQLAADLIATASCTVIAPDLPGHGQSPPRDDCSTERLARDLERLVTGLGLLRAPIVVGHGASAALALAFADAYATRCVLTFDEDQQGIEDEVLRSVGRSGSMLHLTDPQGFAAEIRTLL
ncbi:alpha/beta fold hydrolase [Paractinoplanes rhizophilus]|uniref:Alpha/beta fold hydrolase n=1 Tax=Paractinoplanes rhizophilus TaxID=1416877 RepID=A0ABW2I5J4_9ACTN|nr:alpha/beta fold hydrolase [Actinoplanes sp.]